jgi:hypothetical protein
LDSVRPYTIADAVEDIVTAAAVAEAKGEDCHLPSAANLWHILTEDMPRVPRYTEVSQRSSWNDESEHGGVPIVRIIDQERPSHELDGKEVAYAHSNTLVGHANEVAVRHSENRELADSAMYLADLVTRNDDDLPSYELSATTWPLTPQSATPDIMDSSSATTVHMAEFPAPDPETGMAEHHDPIAHFTSEQDLFKPREQTITTNQPSTSACDLATFLSMGHVENCWCRECEESPKRVHKETLTDDEGWLVWSDDCEESSMTTSTISAEEAAADDWNFATVEEDSYDAANCLEQEFLDWHEIVPCNGPCHPRH